MVTAWGLPVVGVVVLLAAVVPGLWLWWPSRGEAGCRTDLGIALMTGTLVAFAVLVVQILFEVRLSRLESERQAAQESRNQILKRQADRQSLGLAVGIQRDLRGIDLRGRDLSGFFLARKQLNDAQLANAGLEDAFLAGSDLTGADLRGAHLSGANLDDSTLEGAVLTGADLRGALLRAARLRDADLSQADLRGAVLTGASFRDTALGAAKYDSQTQWPKTFVVRVCAPARVCTVGG
jgi:uncharacterized protein YjbI with pentapeptide repeats